MAPVKKEADRMHDGSITFSTALDNADLEKELGRLKKKILRQMEDIGRTEFKRNDLEEQLKAAKEALELLNKIKAPVDADIARLNELHSRIPKIEAEIRKCNEAIQDGNAALEYTKVRYGEILEETSQVRPDESGTGLEKLSEEAAEVNKRLHELAERYADLSEKRVDFDPNEGELLALRQEIKDCVLYLDELAESGQLAELASGAEIAEDRIADLTTAIEEYEDRLENLDLTEEQQDILTAKVEKGKRLLEEYQAVLDRVENPDNAKRNEAQTRRSAYLEKARSLYQKLNGTMKQTSELSSVLQDVAAATAGKLSGTLQTAGKALGSFALKLPNAVAATVKAVTGLTKKVVGLAKRFNIFSKLSDSLSGKFKRLGSTIKSALVFSVIYKGLSLLRQQVGAYLSVNTEFTTALRRLQGVLLTAFQPIYEIVVPALTTLINVLTRAAATVTQFFASLFGTTAKQAQINAKDLYEQANATTAAGDAAEEAAKQLAGFDEINKLEGNKSAGGGGSTSVDTGPLFDYEYDETPFDSWGEAFSAFLDKLLAGIPKLRDAFKNFADWLNDWSKKLYDMFTFPGVLDKVKQLGRDLADALNDLVNWINWYQLGQALGAGLNLALNFLTSFIYEFDWINLGRKLAEFVNGLVSEIDWYEFGRLLWAGFKIGLETLAGFLLGLDMPQLAKAASNVIIGFFDEMINTIKRIQWGEIGRQIAIFLNNIDWYGTITRAMSAIGAAIEALFDMVRGFIGKLRWTDIAAQIYTAINDSIGKVDWSSIGKTLGDLFIDAFNFIRETISGINWYQIGEDIAAFLNGIDWINLLSSLAGAIAAGINAAVHTLAGLVAALDWATIGKAIGEAVNTLVRDIDWAGIGKTFSEGLRGLLTAAIEFVRTVDWLQLGLSIVEALKNIDWIGLLSDLGILIGELFCAALELAFASLKALNDIGGQIVAGLLLGILNALGSIAIWLYDNLVKPIVDAVKSLFGIHSPSTVFAEIGENLIAGLLQGISDTWHSIVEFFTDSVENLKQFFSDAWEAIKTAASIAWESIKTTLSQTWDGLKEKASTVFTSIKDKLGEIWNNIKQNTTSAWENIKSDLSAKWESIKSAVETAFNSVKEKISTAWTAIKTETSSKWTEIKSALSTAWDTIKSSAQEKFTSIKQSIIDKMGELKTYDWLSIGKSIMNGIWDGLKSVWESITSWIRNAANSIASAFSSVSSARSGTFGSVSSGIFGSSRIAVQSLPDMANYTIPKLAQGAVIPPNREFLAVLGDQKSGNNLEGPEGLFRQIVRDENNALISVLREILMAIRAGKEMTVDGDTFAKLVYNGYNSESSRKGVRLTEART